MSPIAKIVRTCRLTLFTNPFCPSSHSLVLNSLLQQIQSQLESGKRGRGRKRVDEEDDDDQDDDEDFFDEDGEDGEDGDELEFDEDDDGDDLDGGNSGAGATDDMLDLLTGD